jgi:hypothetical protein
LVTNTVRRRPSSIDQRHQYDDGFRWLELRVVEITSARNSHWPGVSVDATATGFSIGEMLAVGPTDAHIATPVLLKLHESQLSLHQTLYSKNNPV